MLILRYEHLHEGLNLEIRQQEVGVERMRQDAVAYAAGCWEWRGKKKLAFRVPTVEEKRDLRQGLDLAQINLVTVLVGDQKLACPVH